jgi:ferredoxin-type protein NapF
MQDLVGWIRKKTWKISHQKAHRYKFGRTYNAWRYGFLALPLLFLMLTGSLTLINLLDPYSVFGRIVSDMGLPVLLWFNNRLAGLLESLNIYALYPVQIVPSRILSYVIPFLMLILVTWLSFTRGRLYCNTVCPVGTLLGLLSRISVFRIRMIDSRCTRCAKCVFTCKASCIDMKNLDVDFSRCVACFNCLQVCPENAILYQPSRRNQTTNIPDPLHNTGRRRAIGRMLFGGLALAGLGGKAMAQRVPGRDSLSGEKAGKRTLRAEAENASSVENKIPTDIEPLKHFPVSPPGSLSLHHFTNRCTACHLCVSVCPTGVLKPSLNEYGLTGLLQPHMDYNSNYCNFECVRCSEVCPTGAILPVSSGDKKRIQLGRVQLILENCVVYAENTACGSCSEHCPTQAVTMVPYRNELTLPEIKPEICVGCGACEYACPVKPYKAIYVDGHRIHQAAKEPEIEELEGDVIEDFPF